MGRGKEVSWKGGKDEQGGKDLGGESGRREPFGPRSVYVKELAFGSN